MSIEFEGKIWFWRGPAPWFFVSVPEKESANLKVLSGFFSYGWGCIPAHVRIGETEWKTSLIPKDGSYLVPLKVSVRKEEELEEGDCVKVRLMVR